MTIRFRLYKIFNSKILLSNETIWVYIILKVTVVTKARKVLLNEPQKQTICAKFDAKHPRYAQYLWRVTIFYRKNVVWTNVTMTAPTLSIL